MPCILVAVKKVVFTVFTGLRESCGNRAGLRGGRFGGARGRRPFYALFTGRHYPRTFNEGNLYKLVCK